MESEKTDLKYSHFQNNIFKLYCNCSVEDYFESEAIISHTGGKRLSLHCLRNVSALFLSDV